MFLPLRRTLVTCLAWLLLLLLALPAQAQQLGLTGLVGGGEATAEHDPQAFQESLEQVIATLEDAERRGQLLEGLRELQAVHGEAAEEAALAPRQGLLGALAETLSDLGEQAEAGHSPIDQWQDQLEQGWEDLSGLVTGTGNADLMRFLVEGAVLLGIWVGLLVILIALGRLLARRRGWPLDLPRDPRAWLLTVHFLRRMLPWALAFFLVLGMAQLIPESSGRTMALVVAYIALCGRTLSVVVETFVSVFTRGHRFVAVQILQQRALRPLFVIGALIALGDAFNSGRLTDLIGDELAGLLSVLANMLAALLSIRFILRFQRPIQHIIRNRPWRERRESSGSASVVGVIGSLWHVPALLLVGASLVAIFVTGGDVGTALARSIISASLLVLALVVTGLLRRHGERRSKRHRRRRISQYRQRLERFGYVLAHAATWLAFVELSTQVWGGSLIGIGQQGVASARIGQALLAMAFTVLLAWLAWIFADTAIQRALTSSARTRGRRVNQARAQTITPMIRNVIFTTIVIIAAIVGLANLGVNVTPLLAGAGVIGLAIGFGAQTLVQDLITGIFILIEDSLAVDDFVEINGHMGTVEGLTLRTVRLRDLDGVVHIITFSRIASIHNMSRQFGIALMRIRIPHEMKIDDAISLMQETAQALRQDPMMRHYIWSPLEMQGIQAFEEGCPVLRMRFRTAPEMQWDVARAFNLLLKQRMEEQGLDLAMPRLNISMQGRGGGRLDGSDEGIARATESADALRDAAGREPGEAQVADPEGDTNPRGASPDPGQ
ncbi:mechanosensitive ion channel domain-containing protein [Halomonas sp. JS92-SW72]|uniref:mechanosensitive ion channel family protein n=1 Tax=Halomonas sp. JS92-SW72 TaxID=2306583 RepID=UPI000E5B521B|nr:mechanosensitive ion channel domain-containing protein [Halomonas sp. JS92-SW72]AXY43061.1 mechanosensitive ion channel family protein [Halomonas sp. JS92-SW72]